MVQDLLFNIQNQSLYTTQLLKPWPQLQHSLAVHTVQQLDINHWPPSQSTAWLETVMCLKLIVLFSHVNRPGELLSLGFVVDLLNGHAPFLAPREERSSTGNIKSGRDVSVIPQRRWDKSKENLRLFQILWIILMLLCCGGLISANCFFADLYTEPGPSPVNHCILCDPVPSQTLPEYRVCSSWGNVKMYSKRRVKLFPLTLAQFHFRVPMCTIPGTWN